MLVRNASLLALVVALGSGLFVAGCAKPATVTTSCSSSQLECGGSCVNVQTDSQNCGACGNACGNGSSCQAGKCSCANGFVSCGGSCVASNAQHCGSSCTTCSGGNVCNSDGTCSSTCSSGDKCPDGACSSPTNSADCGTCGNSCTGGTTCVGGSCSCGSSSQMLCSGSCVDITTNTNCGSCGNKCGSGQSCSNGTCVGGGSTGGSTGTGGSGTGTGGSGTGTGGSGTGTGGSTGLAGGSGSRACGAPASGDVVADFEEGFNQNVVQGGRQGWWSAFGDTVGGTQTPAAGTTGPVAAAMVSAPLPSGDACDMYALHSTGTGHTGYVGFGTSFAAVLPPPAGTTTKTRNPYDVSAYDGITFNIKSSSGTAPPIWVEFQNTENVPTPDGTAAYKGVDQYNTRGMLLTTVGTSWSKMYVPFNILAPRYLPNLTESDCSKSEVVCQAPPWDSKNTLGFQFGVYPQFTVQPFTPNTSLNYDVWVDDVTLYKGDSGLGTLNGGTATFADKTYPGCTKPAGAAGKYLIPAYNKWKSTFVTGTGSSTKVIRPENDNDTVSEGIGYGMLIAVYVGDQTLFDGLWAYSQSGGHVAVGTLMNWCVGSGGSKSCSGGGSATDADEDIAFALLQAGKRWGGSYAGNAAKVIGDIWSHDIDTAAMLPNGGSNFGNGMRTNPSYWAPAYYKAFAAVDSGHAWMTIANNTYTALSTIAGKSTGMAAGALVPAWCSGSNCGNVDAGMYIDGGVYQYDAHRVPWRFGIDACWNSATGASTFLSKNAGFFAGLAKTGIGRIEDIYTLSGAVNGDAEPNSMSIVGTAGVGAMAAGNSSFASAAWQFLLDASYSPASFIKDTGGHISYTYFNATVGLLTALTLSGNFNPM